MSAPNLQLHGKGARPDSKTREASAVDFAPLHGVRVVDLSKVLAGPFCIQHLGHLGASVIKIEPCDGGDDTRGWPPFVGRDGAIFMSCNRNKRSLAVDLKSPEGREIVYRLVRGADIFVESYRTGTTECLDVDYPKIRAINPGIIYVSISGFGRTGPLADRPGDDAAVQAFSGIMSITGERDGSSVRSAFPPLDQTTGILGSLGAHAALRHRDATGEGRLIEVSLFETALSLLGYTAQIYWANGVRPKRVGSGHESLCPYQVFAAADGEIFLAIASDRLWKRFCAAAGLDALQDDPRFSTSGQRADNFSETVGLVAEVMRTKTVEEWVERLSAAGVPHSPVNAVDEVLDLPHTRERGMILSFEHPLYGAMRCIGFPIDFEDAERGAPVAPPMLGQHAAEVLTELGYDMAQIEVWHRQGLVRMGAPQGG